MTEYKQILNKYDIINPPMKFGFYYVLAPLLKNIQFGEIVKLPEMSE